MHVEMPLQWLAHDDALLASKHLRKHPPLDTALVIKSLSTMKNRAPELELVSDLKVAFLWCPALLKALVSLFQRPETCHRHMWPKVLTKGGAAFIPNDPENHQPPSAEFRPIIILPSIYSRHARLAEHRGADQLAFFRRPAKKIMSQCRWSVFRSHNSL